MGPKIIVKLPFNKQVLNNNFKEIHWTHEDDLSLIKIIQDCNVVDFNASNVNIEELSTLYKVPIEFLLKKFVQLYNELKLETHVENSTMTVVTHRSLKNRDIPKDESQLKEVIDTGKSTVVNNGTYSYYIDNTGYQSKQGSESEEDEEDEDEPPLIHSSELLLHHSRLLPLPDLLDNSSLEDFFSDGKLDETEDEFETNNKTTQKISNIPSAFNTRRQSILILNRPATMLVTDEDVNGIISTRRQVDRKNSGSSDLSNRSELEKLLLDRL